MSATQISSRDAPTSAVSAGGMLMLSIVARQGGQEGQPIVPDERGVVVGSVICGRNAEVAEVLTLRARKRHEAEIGGAI